MKAAQPRGGMRAPGPSSPRLGLAQVEAGTSFPFLCLVSLAHSFPKGFWDKSCEGALKGNGGGRENEWHEQLAQGT